MRMREKPELETGGVRHPESGTASASRNSILPLPGGANTALATRALRMEPRVPMRFPSAD
jgi:hypothetical protein